MLWFGKQADPKKADLRDRIQPAELKIGLDPEICAAKLGALVEQMAERGGPDEFVGALRAKHELFARALEPGALAEMSSEGFGAILETVFTARRRLPPVVREMDLQGLTGAARELLYGSVPLLDRMNAFAGHFAAGGAKVRRAAWDVGAEMLHFRAPEQYPLMTRWVWDPNTESGSLREFLKANDTLRDIPLDDRPETFEGARSALAEQLASQGFYRDVVYMVDLLLAQAYSDYLRAMSSGMSMLAADFGAKDDPLELVTKMLGIDPARRSGQSRLKAEAE
ncbi:MAG: hypothetical protein WCC36_04000 [Gammaproteobacteria bacterium]